MMRGKSFKLFVISTIMTQRDTVILIEPPRKEAAPSRACLQSTNIQYMNEEIHNKQKNEKKETMNDS